VPGVRAALNLYSDRVGVFDKPSLRMGQLMAERMAEVLEAALLQEREQVLVVHADLFGKLVNSYTHYLVLSGGTKACRR
jgi:hypothetical protein